MISTCNKILLIDNKDSFTFNLVHLFESLGCKVTISDSFDLKTDCFLDYRQIVFSPGPGLPEDFPVMSHILKSISKETKVLGVCLGHQSIAQYFGAKLFKQDKVQHGQQKRILKSESCQNTSLQYLPESFLVGVYHSWAVVPESIPKDLLITCMSEDQVVMGLKHKYLPLEGVQFHPESFLTNIGSDLVRNWLAL